MYERGQGDKIIPSDLRPPPVLKVGFTDILEASMIDIFASVLWITYSMN